jgi:hypothetical protein
MKIKLLNKETDKNQETKQVISKLQKEEKIETIKKEGSIFQIPEFQQYSALMKLRIVVITIFSLCTISMILIFVGGWEISAVLLLIGYLMLFFLMLKLFRVKKL